MRYRRFTKKDKQHKKEMDRWLKNFDDPPKTKRAFVVCRKDLFQFLSNDDPIQWTENLHEAKMFSETQLKQKCWHFPTINIVEFVNRVACSFEEISEFLDKEVEVNNIVADVVRLTISEGYK